MRRWILRSLATDPPRAKSLIVTVWGDSLAAHGGAAWLAGLIRVMAPFGVSDRLVRTSVFRLAREGWLAGASEGRNRRYHLTPEGARRFDEAHARIYARPAEEWHGEWELVLAHDVAGSQRARLRETLAWAGFGEIGVATFARPHDPKRKLPPLVTEGRQRDSAIVMRATEMPGGGSLTAAVNHAWDLASLATDYRRFLARFGAVIDRFRGNDSPSPEQCFVVRTLLIHAYRRVLLRDPLLPAVLLPLDWPGAAAYALCRDFYRLTHRHAERHLAVTLGSASWPWPPANAAFMERFGGLQDPPAGTPPP